MLYLAKSKISQRADDYEILTYHYGSFHSIFSIKNTVSLLLFNVISFNYYEQLMYFYDLQKQLFLYKFSFAKDIKTKVDE